MAEVGVGAYLCIVVLFYFTFVSIASVWNVERVRASKASAQSQNCCLQIPFILYQLIDTRLELRFRLLSYVWREVYLIPRFLLRTDSKALKLYCIP